MFTKGLFPCQDSRGCPEQLLRPGDARFCPCWYSPQNEYAIMEENVSTGQVRMVEGCCYQVLPRLMEYVIKASNRPAEEIGAMRTEVVRAAANAVAISLQPLSQALTHQENSNGDVDTVQ